jgi:hypothetical protein
MQEKKKGKEWKGENAIAVPKYCLKRAKRVERREIERERERRGRESSSPSMPMYPWSSQ